jgi:hypothetical protein
VSGATGGPPGGGTGTTLAFTGAPSRDLAAAGLLLVAAGLLVLSAVPNRTKVGVRGSP